MPKVIKCIFIPFAALLFTFSISPIVQAQEARIYLKFNDQSVSVDLEEAPLKAIVKRFKEEKGIWFKGRESLFDEKVSLQFKDLPIQHGLERILSAMNYSLIFDKNANLVGVILVSKSGTASRKERMRSIPPRRIMPRRAPRRTVIPPEPRE